MSQWSRDLFEFFPCNVSWRDGLASLGTCFLFSARIHKFRRACLLSDLGQDHSLSLTLMHILGWDEMEKFLLMATLKLSITVSIINSCRRLHFESEKI